MNSTRKSLTLGEATPATTLLQSADAGKDRSASTTQVPTAALSVGTALLTPQAEQNLNTLRRLASALAEAEAFDPAPSEWKLIKDDDLDVLSSPSSMSSSGFRKRGVTANEPPTGTPLLVHAGSAGLRFRLPPVPRAQDTVLSVLQDLGNRIKEAASALASSMEEQMLLVFAQHDLKKKQVEDEVAVIRKHRWEGEPSPAPSPPPALTPAPPPQPRMPATMRSPKRARRGGAAAKGVEDSLGASLYLSTEALVSVTRAERGLLYLHQQQPDGAQVLRCLARVPPRGDLANDDLPAMSTSFASAVWQTGIGIHCAAPDPGKAASRRLRHVLAVPVAGPPPHRRPVGVLVLQNKRGQPVGEGFTLQDESTAVMQSVLISSTVAKYPARLWHGPRFNALLCKEVSLPSFRVAPQTADELLGPDGAACDASTQRHLLYRVSGTDSVLPREVAESATDVATNIVQLRDCGMYLRNLEGMWRKALTDGATLRTDLKLSEAKCSDRERESVALELTLRDVAHQCSVLKEEVAALKRQAEGQLPSPRQSPQMASVSGARSPLAGSSDRTSVCHSTGEPDGFLPPIGVSRQPSKLR